MREFGVVRIGFWSSTTVSGWDDKTKLLALYLLAGPHTTAIGAFRCPVGYVAADLGWSSETVSKGFRNLSDTMFCTYYDRCGWVVLHNYMVHNPPQNANQRKNIESLFDGCPSEVRVFLSARLLDTKIQWADEFRTVLERFRNGFETVSEEYRRKEKEKEKEKDISARSPSDSAPNDEAVVTIPAIGGDDYPVTQAQIDEWSETFTGVDVLQQVKEARAWCNANPTKRKTARGVPKFLVGWLSREQDRGGKSNGFPSKTQDQPQTLGYLKPFGSQTAESEA